MSLFNIIDLKNNLSQKRTICKAKIEELNREIDNLKNDINYFKNDKENTKQLLINLAKNNEVKRYISVKGKLQQYSKQPKTVLVDERYCNNDDVLRFNYIAEEYESYVSTYYTLKNNPDVHSYIDNSYKVIRDEINIKKSQEKLNTAISKLAEYEKKYQQLTQKIRNQRTEIFENIDGLSK